VHLVGFIIRIYHDARSPERGKSGCCGVEELPMDGSRIYQTIDAVYGNNQLMFLNFSPPSLLKRIKLRFRNTIGPCLQAYFFQNDIRHPMNIYSILGPG